MSTRSKSILKQAKSKAKKTQTLETADDFQAAGVDFEDAAGKWRAGDAVKSVRFFERALQVYSSGLEKHPQSFDLAYNKARVELELATHPILIKQLQQPVLSLLETSLQSHRVALSLDQDSPDTLFNTAQVLTSIAEELTKDDARPATDILQLLEEALELQSRCLSVQEIRYEESQELQQQQSDQNAGLDSNSDREDGGTPISSAAQAQEEQWFTIIEPVTVDVLIDSVIAQLNTLTILCTVLSSSPDSAPSATLPWVEEFSSKLIASKLPLLLGRVDADDQPARQQEATLAKANFVSALLEAGFRTNKIDVETYKRERDVLFTAPELDKDDNTEALFANTRSLFSFNSALADAPPAAQSSSSANIRWNALSTASIEMAKASKLSGISSDDLSKTHLYRGDAALLEYIMGQPPLSYPPAVANQAQLLKNADVFYRNASKLTPDTDDRAIATLRSGVAMFLATREKSPILAVAQSKGEAWVQDEIEDMIVEGLLPADFSL